MNLKNIVSLMAVLPLFSMTANAGATAVGLDTIGAKAMPEAIEKLGEMPFKMKDLKRPSFPDRTVTLTQASIGEDGKIAGS